MHVDLTKVKVMETQMNTGSFFCVYAHYWEIFQE